jgi:predicted RNA-binding Zn ribbon-like protein
MEWQFDLCGGRLALDFANTVSDRHTTAPIERVRGYPDLVSFARQTGVVTAGQAAALLGRARRDDRAAGRSHARAVALRNAMYRLFAAVARQEPPAVEDVENLDRELDRLCIGADLSLAWRDPPDTLDGFMGAVVHDAVRLVTDPAERSRVRLCEAPDCVWLFYDSSRNRSRRWCDMRQCGNRMKARRHYARGKSGTP